MSCTIQNLLTDVFRKWHDSNAPVLVLRNYEFLPERINGDLDLLVTPEFLGRAESDLVSAARTHSFVLVNRTWFSPLALYFANLETGQQIHIDLFQNLVWRGITLIDASRVQARRRLYRELFFVPHPADEAAVKFLTQQMYRGRVKDSYQTSIQEAFSSFPVEAASILRTLFGADSEDLLALIQRGQWKEASSFANTRKRAVVLRQFRHPTAFALQTVHDSIRLVRRFLRPPGVTVVLLGPDGAGKSTLAKLLKDKLGILFSPEKSRYIHWKPTRKKTASDSINHTDPHAKTPRSLSLSTAFLLFHWLGFLLGSWQVVRPLLFRNGLVVIDRYFHDMQVDLRRYRLNPKTPGIPFLTALLPAPDLVFILDAPAEVLQARKAEVTLEETKRQGSAYKALSQNYPQSRVVNAALPPEEVATQACREVLLFLEKRAQERIM